MSFSYLIFRLPTVLPTRPYLDLRQGLLGSGEWFFTEVLDREIRYEYPLSSRAFVLILKRYAAESRVSGRRTAGAAGVTWRLRVQGGNRDAVCSLSGTRRTYRVFHARFISAALDGDVN